MVESVSQQSWPARAQSYKLTIPIGMGSFGLVWKADAIEGPNAKKSVAIKIVDLEQFQDNSIDDIRKEISIMSTCQHKNVVSCYVSFIEGTDLWLVMPILSAGSCYDIMRLNFPQGIKNEVVIATILRETVLGLQYFHENKQIHRDIKAGNILLDMEGNVFISDFGVSASLKKGQKRKTFVGSPCWMAPEVMEQTGHDYAADIWSLGITAIELAQGEAPYSDKPAMKVILSIINQAPPSLSKTDKWDQSFRDFVADCLQKDPSKRPTSLQILKDHKKFFSKAKNNAYLKEHFIADLPEVHQRKDSSLIMQAEEYLNKKIKTRVKRVEVDNQASVPWDFGSGDQSKLIADNKKQIPQEQINDQNKSPIQPTKASKQQAKQGDNNDDLFDDLEES